MDKKTAKLIADKILEDMCGRSGGDHWYDGCDKEIQREIRQEWADIVYKFANAEKKQPRSDDGNDR